MKLNLVLTFLCVLIFTTIFSSCGDDTLTPNNPSGVLFSKDSMSVWLTPGGVSFGSDSNAYSTQNTGTVRVEFTLQSNADSSAGATAYCSFNTNAGPPIPIDPYIYNPVDSQVTLNLSFSTTQATFFSFAISLTANGIVMPYYIRLKNIKVTKE